MLHRRETCVWGPFASPLDAHVGYLVAGARSRVALRQRRANPRPPMAVAASERVGIMKPSSRKNRARKLLVITHTG
jgi:hypothetical protein